MFRWTLSIKTTAQKDIVRLGEASCKQVITKLSWLEKNIDSIIPARLSGNMSDFYKLRVGDYRVIYDFNMRRLIINVYRVEHRSRVYKK